MMNYSYDMEHFILPLNYAAMQENLSAMVKCLLVVISLWIPLVFAESRCSFSEDTFSCTNLEGVDYMYEFYKNEVFSEGFSPGTEITDYRLELLDSKYGVIEKIVNLPIGEDITILITVLKITNCSVEHVKVDAFQELTSLRSLNLSWNKITNVTFILPSALEYLDLSHNRITIVDFNLLRSPSTVKLDFNLIDTLLPTDQSKLYQFVDISFNEVTRVSLRRSCTLYSYNCYDDDLQLHGNPLTSIVSSQSYSVKNLDLSFSTFNLSASMFEGDIYITESLSVHDCKISYLDNNLLNFKVIHLNEEKGHIDISNSSIRNISENLFNNVHLHSLNLSLNNLEVIKSDSFMYSTIDVLDLSFSGLKVIEPDAFRYLESNALYLHKK
ncbi:hypothetical protein NQ318_020605 [Aromia moschata]|uniref:Uncharacterized protein n=1 Tax=Aromia moschata TaxID=1265417 RepID=A0AAV8Z3A7_9CUCU|nr:hypothetical protein NQ318_020605 [Aromia moschata]